MDEQLKEKMDPSVAQHRAQSGVRNVLMRPATTTPRAQNPIEETTSSGAAPNQQGVSVRRYALLERRDVVDAGKRRPKSPKICLPSSHVRKRPQSAATYRSGSPPQSQKLSGFAGNDSTLEIARTYFLEGVRIGQKGPDGRECVLQNFCVRVAPGEVADSPLTEYMRIYYCDTLGAAPAPDFLTKDQRTIDIEPLCQWLLDSSPRSRIDALPFLLLTKEVLRRFLSRDITIISERERKNQDALYQVKLQLSCTCKELDAAENCNADLRQEVKDTSSKLEDLYSVQAQLNSSLKQIKNLEAKIEKMIAASELQAILMAEKMEEVRKTIREKTEATWERTVQLCVCVCVCVRARACVCVCVYAIYIGEKDDKRKDRRDVGEENAAYKAPA
jgi:hypothetical protein